MPGPPCKQTRGVTSSDSLPYRAYQVPALISVPGTSKTTVSVFEGAGRVLDKAAAVPAAEFMTSGQFKFKSEKGFWRIEEGAKLAL